MGPRTSLSALTLVNSPRTEHDFRMLLGVDVLELAWFVADP